LSAFILGHRYFGARFLEGLSSLTLGRGGHLPFVDVGHFLLLSRKRPEVAGGAPGSGF
jgi:hypothetical protein